MRLPVLAALGAVASLSLAVACRHQPKSDETPLPVTAQLIAPQAVAPQAPAAVVESSPAAAAADPATPADTRTAPARTTARQKKNGAKPVAVAATPAEEPAAAPVAAAAAPSDPASKKPKVTLDTNNPYGGKTGAPVSSKVASNADLRPYD